MTSCHTESILVLWRYESSYGKDGTTKIRKCKKKTLSIRVEDALYERICTYAEQHQLTVTEVVLQGLDKVLSDFE